MILRKLKRLLGLGSDEDGGRSERDVTVQERDEADAESEAAVKGVGESDEEPVGGGESDEPVAAGTDADASTESMVDEEFTQEEPSGRAEPAEAAGQAPDEGETEAEPESPDVEVEEDEAAGTDDSPPVDEIRGIGPAYSERLGEIGIETVADLRGADPEEVAERTTAPEGTVQKWIDRAHDED